MNLQTSRKRLYSVTSQLLIPLAQRAENIPRQTDGKQANPITANDQEIGNLSALHRVSPESGGLDHLETPDENKDGRDDTKAE